MTSAFFSRRLALLAVMATAVGLAACSKSDSSSGGTTTVRALNVTSDLASIDIYVGGNKNFSALTTAGITSYASLDANAYAINVNSVDNTTSLFTNSYTLSKDGHYTLVVWGSQSSLRVSALPEDETAAIGTGNTRVRMFNATTESGSMDVYFTSTDADLASSTATQASLTAGTLAGFKEIPAGTYRLRVTDIGKPDVIRLDMPSVTLSAGAYSTLVLTAGAGGILVNGTLIAQQGSATALTNTQARVRIVSSVDSSGVVAANVSGTLLNAGLTSPAIDTYRLITAGTVNATIRVNNVTLLSGPLTFTAGADYTLLVYGPPTAAMLSVITDDNRIPLTTLRTKIRVINGVAGLGALSLLVDLGPVAASSNVLPGTASPYAQVTSDTAANVEVDASSLGTPVYVTTRTNGDSLASQGVYTVFVLSGRSTPTGTLRNERP